MIDGVHAAERMLDGSGISDVCANQLDIGMQIIRTIGSRAMHLRRQYIERANAVTMLQKFVGDVRADESGSASDQDVPATRHADYRSDEVILEQSGNFSPLRISFLGWLNGLLLPNSSSFLHRFKPGCAPQLGG